MPRLDRQEGLVQDNLKAAAISRRDRDIGFDYPGPGNLERRRACEQDLLLFLTTYFPAAFPLEFGPDHRRVISRMQESILEGGLGAIGLPRGSGKTSIATRSAVWALLYRHRRFVPLIGATERRGTDLLKTIKVELTQNPRIVADFRQVTHALVKLQGHARRAIGQLFDNAPTNVQWAADHLVFPTVPQRALDGPDVSGSVITVAGLTGAIRGQQSTLADGTILRPEMVILDDIQSRESAMSTTQCQERLALINGDVLGMAGPDQKVSCLALLTVIRAGDVADVLLDRDRSPRWHGERCRLLDSLPTDEKLWDTYARLRAESLRRGGSGQEATVFYQSHRTEMDAGASASWPARFLPDEASAIQSGMNLKIDDEASFMSEYQGTPMRPDLSDSPRLSPAEIASKVNGIPRGELPPQAEHVTGFIDVHDNVLYWCVCGWSPRFDGWICDYSTWPRQNLDYFTLRKAPHTLAAKYSNCGKEAAIRAGLMDLTAYLASREFRREDGAAMHIGKLFIDCGYVPDVVYDVCRHSPHAAVLMPARGDGIGAARLPIREYDGTRGDVKGHFWMIRKPGDKRSQRHFQTDTNYWKSFCHARLAVALGDPGCLSLFGSEPSEHRLIADHLTAEIPIRTYGHGRCVDEWKTLPDRQDQHWFDATVGCAAAASYLGAALDGMQPTVVKQPRKKIFMSDLQRAKSARVPFGQQSGFISEYLKHGETPND